jgi:hypothetical protein
VLADLRAADRLDELGEVYAPAAVTCAAEVDAAVAPGSDVPTYARGRIIGPYLRSLELLDGHVRPVPETDPWAAFLSDAEWADWLERSDPAEQAAGALAARGWGDPFPLVDDSSPGTG